MLEKDRAEILTDAKHLILSQRDGLFNVVLTITGGALILSPNLIKIGISSNYILLLKYSWIFLVASIFFNLLTRFSYVEKIINRIEREERQRDNVLTAQFYSLARIFQNSLNYAAMPKTLVGFFWVSFILGIVLLLLFSLLIY